MNSRKQNKSRRHPLVRFFRSVYRLFKVLLKPKSNKIRPVNYQNERSISSESLISKSQQSSSESLVSSTQSDSYPTERLITVGELFGQIKWQLPPAIDRDELADKSQEDSRIIDASRN
jgi:hypothetical protein